MTMIFTPPHDNDASATIRGFVYQIDRTILKWLDLTDGQELELERGEDIDVVWKNPNDDEGELQRKLEQVKAKNKPVTLRRDWALDALVSFSEHHRNNPNHPSLLFCFVTNAPIGCERNVENAPLIKRWEQIRSGELAAGDVEFAARQMSEFLLSLRKPKKIKDTRWKMFQHFIQTSDWQKFRAFLSTVEWLTGQAEPVELESTIRLRLSSQYAIPSNQAESSYHYLFFKVTKLLTTGGQKSLSVADRTKHLSSLVFNQAEQSEFEKFNNYFSMLNRLCRVEERLDKHDERHDKLEERQDKLERLQLSLPSVDEIEEACANITNRTVQQITANRSIIHREILSNQFAEFMRSPSRHCLLLGHTDMGKSTLLATEARALLASGWTVLLLRADDALPTRAATRVTEELARHSHPLSWQQIINLMNTGSARLMLMLDALDEADRKILAFSLKELIDSLGATETQRFKVVVSCKQAVWEDLFEVNALLREAQTPDVVNPISTLKVTEFSGSELDSALAKIGALELLPANHQGTKLDAHTSALRSLLKHPAAFRNYAMLRQHKHLVHALTWDGLVKQRLEVSLQEVSGHCGWAKDNLHAALRAFAMCAVEKSARDFNLDDQIVSDALPQLYELRASAKQTPLQALIHCDLLQQTTRKPDSTQVSFRDSDMAAYLLSFDLEEQFEKKPDDDLREFFIEINGRNWKFPAWGDALLALLNRWLTAKPRPPRLRRVFKALLENHDFHRSSFINLLTPDVLAVIFELYQRDEVSPDFYCVDATIAVRNSPESAAIARQHLNDSDDKVRRLSVSLAGNYHDAEAVEPLLNILPDAEHSLSSAVYQTLGKIGYAALPAILSRIRDTTQELSLRKNYVYALPHIGYRDKETSAALHDCLTTTNDTEFLSAALLAAAALRDDHHTEAAQRLLQHSAPRVVHAAAKYLTVCPSQAAFVELQSALLSQDQITGDALYQSMLPSQLITALLKTDRARAFPIVLPILLEGLKDNGLFKYSFSTQILRKNHIHEAISETLRVVVAELRQSLHRNQAWYSARYFETLWHPDELEWLTNTVAQLQQEGTDTVALFVDAIAANIHISSDDPIGDSFNRVDDLIPLAKAQAPTVLTEAFRLVPLTARTSLMDLCEWFWVAAETRAEEVLLTRLNRQEAPSTEGLKQSLRMEHEAIVNAFGTCGKEKGAAAVLNHLQNDNDLSYALVDRSLVPLLRREYIKPAQLADIAKNQSASPGSRELSFLALEDIGYLAQDKGLLLQLSEDSSFRKLQQMAVLSLHHLPCAEATPALIKILRTRSAEDMPKAAAAWALSRFRDPQFVSEIESECENNDRYFLQALANYGHSSSVPLITAGLANAEYPMQHFYLVALGAFAACEEGRQAILREIEKWEDAHPYHDNLQSPLIEGLLRHAPNLALHHLQRAYDNKFLQSRACETVAYWLRLLHKRADVDRKLLLEATVRLVCERKVATREAAAQSLLYADTEFRQTLFARLTNGSTSAWQRACGFYSLAYWREETDELPFAQYDQEAIVRKMADEALAVREKRLALETHIKKLTSADGLMRLSAYLCLKEQGSVSTLWQLDESIPNNSVASAYLKPLATAIERRLESEYRKRESDEEEFQKNRSTIFFD